MTNTWRSSSSLKSRVCLAGASYDSRTIGRGDALSIPSELIGATSQLCFSPQVRQLLMDPDHPGLLLADEALPQWAANQRRYGTSASPAAVLREALTGSGYHLVQREYRVGYGPAAFRSASERLLHGDLHRAIGMRPTRRVRASSSVLHGFIPSAEVELSASHPMEVGDLLILHWLGTRSRCRIIALAQTDTTTAMIYTACRHHLEAGEEAFIVHQHDDGSVMGGCFAFSRHRFLPARLVSPLADAIQLAFTDGYLRAMESGGEGRARKGH